MYDLNEIRMRMITFGLMHGVHVRDPVFARMQGSELKLKIFILGPIGRPMRQAIGRFLKRKFGVMQLEFEIQSDPDLLHRHQQAPWQVRRNELLDLIIKYR